MMPIAKNRLEDICALYLNHQPRVRPVARVSLNRPGAGNANWSLGEVEPHFDLHDVRPSLTAIRELQSVFRMVA
ncbi:MAG: hypothetical protein ABI608_10945 [Rhizomicrobium sp.]